MEGHGFSISTGSTRDSPLTHYAGSWDMAFWDSEAGQLLGCPLGHHVPGHAPCSASVERSRHCSEVHCLNLCANSGSCTQTEDQSTLHIRFHSAQPHSKGGQTPTRLHFPATMVYLRCEGTTSVPLTGETLLQNKYTTTTIKQLQLLALLICPG